MSTQRPVRLRALDHALTYAGIVKENPSGSNSGGLITKWLKGAGVPDHNPWCMAFVHGMYAEVGVTLGGWAGVGNFRDWAQSHGYLVVNPERPFAGDIVCYEWEQDTWPDHVGIVRKVKAVRFANRQFVGWVETCEGNTSPGTFGSQGDGDGVYIRRRWMKPLYQFVRIPG